MKTIRTERVSCAARLLALAAAALLTTTPLCAEPGADRAQARAHFERGVAFGKQHAYREALAEFQLAYAAFASHNVLYNIAQALILLERPSEAVITLERYLSEGGALIEPQRRREVEATIQRERDKTGSIACLVEPSGALITLDDNPVGRSPLPAPLRADPGTHRVRATLDSGPSREITVEVSAQQLAQAHFDLTPSPAPASVTPTPPVALLAPPATPPAPTPMPTPAHAPDHATQRTLGYAIGAAGLVLSGVAVGHYVWNRGRYEDWQARSSAYYGDPSDQNREAANSLGRSIPAASAVTVGLAIGAGVALATGSVLILTASPSPRSSGARASGATLHLRGEF